MKRLYSLFFIALVGLVGFAAAAQGTFTFNINEPSKVTISLNGITTTLTGESNQLTFNQYEYMTVTCVDGWMIKSLVNQAGTPISFYGNSANFMPEDGYTYTMEVYNLDESRTASCTVTVDDASKVRLMRSGSYSYVDLVNGSQTVKYNPDIESDFSISSTGSSPLYKVELDGTPVAGSYGNFSVKVTQGCNVNIQANFPEGDADVTFTYGDKAEGFWTGASVNGTPVAGFDGKKFSAAFGSQITIEGNTNDYAYQSITVNGEPVQYFYGSYSFTLTANTEVHVDAHPFGNIKFVINIDDPNNVSFYRGYKYENNPITGLVAGKNDVEISEKNSTLTIEANPGCFITSVTDGAGNVTGNQINVTEGMVINVISGAITLDKAAAVWVDDIAAAINFFNCVLDMGSERKTYNLVSGYNLVQFCEQYNDLNIGWHGAPVNLLYLNQQLQASQYEGSNTYMLDLADGDVVKLFLATDPEEVKVNFTAEGNPEVKVTRDVLTEIADWAGLRDQVFAGTEYVITGGPEIKVTVNGNELVSEAGDGIFKLTTDAATKEYNVTISATAGVSDVTAEAVSADDAVYNMQGMRVGRRADLGTLPAGLYIVGGEKVMKQ